MARTNNLTNFLTDVATAIKEKKGLSSPIPASEFDTEISSIQTKGNYQEKSITLSDNGNYTLNPDEGYDAMEKVDIITNIVTPQINRVYETEEDMRADLNPVRNGMGIIYKENGSIHSSLPDTHIHEIYLPETIVLPREVTEEIRIPYTMKEESRGGGGSSGDRDLVITPTAFSVNMYMGMSDANFEYISEDGINYTRTTASVETWEPREKALSWENDTLTFIQTEYYERYLIYTAEKAGENVDLAKAIFRVNTGLFKQLYKYASYPSDTYRSMYKGLYWDDTEKTVKYTEVDNEVDPTPFNKVFELLENYSKEDGTYGFSSTQAMIKLSDSEYRVYTTYYSKNESDTTYLYTPMLLHYNGDLYYWATRSNEEADVFPGIVVFNVNIETGVVEDISDSLDLVKFTQIPDPEGLNLDNIIAVKFPTNYNMIYYDKYTPNHLVGVKYLAENEEGVLTFYYTRSFAFEAGIEWDWQALSTQFTLESANMLMPDMTALGKNGAVTGDGTIYDVIPDNVIVSKYLNIANPSNDSIRVWNLPTNYTHYLKKQDNLESDISMRKSATVAENKTVNIQGAYNALYYEFSSDMKYAYSLYYNKSEYDWNNVPMTVFKDNLETGESIVFQSSDITYDSNWGYPQIIVANDNCYLFSTATDDSLGENEYCMKLWLIDFETKELTQKFMLKSTGGYGWVYLWATPNNEILVNFMGNGVVSSYLYNAITEEKRTILDNATPSFTPTYDWGSSGPILWRCNQSVEFFNGYTGEIFMTSKADYSYTADYFYKERLFI